MAKLIKKKISDSYRKNKDDIKTLVSRTYPKFILKKTGKIPNGQIPVFTFHDVLPERFESQLVYLAENGYKTLKASEFYDIITCRKEPVEKSVLLTFDDGLGSLWSCVYPLLKKYGFNAVSFLVSSVIKNEADYYPNLEDVWLGKTPLNIIIERDKRLPLCTWLEIKEMYKSGVIDFQSHTSYHSSVFISDKIVDFINPSLQPSFLNSDFNPVINLHNDVVPDKLELGYPVYQWGPSMSSPVRYIENKEVCREITNYVRSNGGKDFFNRRFWRMELKKYLKQNFSSLKGKFQSNEERYCDILNDLLNSKRMIEAKLDNSVNQLCYPWFCGSDFAVQASKEAGYLCNYWGLIDNKDINKVGDNPYYITRLHDDYVFSLPGSHRLPLVWQISSKILRYGFKIN